MIKLKKPLNVKYFVGTIFREKEILDKVIKILKKKFGEIEFESEIFPFTHTDYYEEEMGKNLMRKFFSFKPLKSPEELVKLKLFTVEVEKKFMEKNKRRVNIDPGYVELSKVVLASTKNFSHRIYLGKGIYAEVTLYFKKGEFHPLFYTYPDYRTKEYIEFFKKVRNSLKNSL